LAAAGGGVLLFLAFPPTGLDFLAWVAFVPLFWAVEREDCLFRATLAGAAFAGAFFALDMSWIHRTLILHGHFGGAAAASVFFGLILVLSFFPAAFSLALSVLRRGGIAVWVAAPCAWTAVEFARGHMFTGFPWDLLGYSLSERLMLIQIADRTGVYGLSFLVVLVNAALWEFFSFATGAHRFPWKSAVITVCLVAITVGYGHGRISAVPPENSGEGFKISLLQGNIPQELKWEVTARDHTFATYEKLGNDAARQGAQFLVWPETGVPVLFGGRSGEWKPAGAISRKLGLEMLVGAPSVVMRDGQTRYYNSAFILDGEMLRYRYDKIHLVPFGEYMPLSWLLPLGPGIAAREADYSPGSTMTVMTAPEGPRFSVLICYEAIFPELSRLALANGAQMLINITNDGWFGRTAAPFQHLAMARLRSVENRVWLLRCANTGISAAFDPAGRRVGTIPLETEGILTVTVPSSPRVGSFYSRWGDVFAWFCVGACVVMGFFVFLPRRRRV
jgi:apolipoprotein N-acyltransferase